MPTECAAPVLLQEEGGPEAALDSDSDAEAASPPRQEAAGAPYEDDEFEEDMELEEEEDQDMVRGVFPPPPPCGSNTLVGLLGYKLLNPESSDALQTLAMPGSICFAFSCV